MTVTVKMVSKTIYLLWHVDVQEFRKSHDVELLNTIAAQELKLVTYSKRLI